MTASPVRVDARVEADVGAVVAGDDGARVIPEVDGLGTRCISFELAGVRLDLDPLEAVLRVADSTATDDAPPWPLSLHPPILIARLVDPTARFAPRDKGYWSSPTPSPLIRRSRREICSRVPRTMRVSPARMRSLAEGLVSKVPSLLRVARIMAPVLSPIRSSPIVWPAMNESLGTLNSSSLNSSPFSPRVTMSRKSTIKGCVASEASLLPPTA